MKQFINTLQCAPRSEQTSITGSVAIPVALVVDDSATNRIVVERQLIKLGCAVLTACDGAGALAAIEKGGIDLVLLDCQMPDMSGYEVARFVRNKAPPTESSEQTHLPIIAISGDTDAQHMQRCFDSGMDAVLVKPLPLAVLRNLLALWCNMDSLSTIESGAGSGTRIDLQSLYQGTSRQDFDALYHSVQQADFRMVAKLAHRMKGAALAFGAMDVVVSLERIEAIVSFEFGRNTLEMAPAIAAAELMTLLAQLRRQLQVA